MTEPKTSETPVLIVGGGITGLSAALFLARQGVRPILVERHPSTSILPQARAFNPRTVEIFRGLGLEPEIRARQSILAGLPEMIGADTLAGTQRFRLDVVGALTPADTVAATEWAMIDQDELERIVRRHAEAAGADVRFGTELTDVTTGPDGVRATVRDSDGEHVIEAAYLIAADGHRAGIRARLGIGAEQTLAPAPALYAVFDADLTTELRGRRFLLAYLDRPVPGTVLVPLRQDGRWMFGMPYFPERGDDPASFTEDRCADLIRQAVGHPGLDVTLVPPVPGQPHRVSLSRNGGWVADRFRAGRVFVIGDAAHVMPPSGSYGASTGIADAHNLAWKLAAVLSGTAGDALLDTYDTERRPVARATVAQAIALLGTRLDGDTADVRRAEDLSLIFGHPCGPGPVVDPRAVTGEPGLRAPHVWLERGGDRLSTHDLFGGGWTLLTADPGDTWPAAARAVAADLGVTVDVHRIGVDLADPDGRFPRGYGLSATGATLVRPDGFVAWRTPGRPDDPAAELRTRLATVLRRPSPQLV